ncbi:hypothetical protein G4Z16_01550 [Streptomyces bathyalis]|uniref:DUF4034 domain-containing protein n=1 Tax=Streptomyces bathyalis TaxID=2710756 RepID=A0A7T1WQG9_9ACTN|nr:hypothetical protein [Streptomyces bathyalis]QPP05289.1 hypothetical protein G4Z16_01550 [Streptomyces bathyalis]
MVLFSGRRKPRLAPALDDAELGRFVKSLLEVPRAGMIGMADLHMARMADLLKQAGTDWDRRTYRLSVLAEATAASGVPSAWAAREPDNPDALLLSAWALLTQGRWSGGLNDAVSLVKSCYRAAELSPEDPAPWVIVLAVARLERYERGSLLAVWREVQARDPWNREAHLQLLGYLSPEEGGSRVDVLDFVDFVLARAPADAPTAALELTAAALNYQSVVARGGVEALMARDLWKHPQVAKALDQAAATWPQPGFLHHAAAQADLNLLAYALCTAERRSEAAAVFTTLEGAVTDWPWNVDGRDPVDVFSHEQSRTV